MGTGVRKVVLLHEMLSAMHGLSAIGACDPIPTGRPGVTHTVRTHLLQFEEKEQRNLSHLFVHDILVSMTPLITIAIFPLQLVIFPGEVIPLHIFEPRYKQLIQECRDDGIHFVIPLVVNKGLSRVATEVELLEITKTHDNGEMDIRVRGIRAVRIHEVMKTFEDRLYAAAKVSYVENQSNSDSETDATLQKKIALISVLLKQPNPLKEASFESLSFAMAPHVALSLPQRMELLELGSERDRQDYLMAHMDGLIKKLNEVVGGNAKKGTNGRMHSD